jgi:hypothetical protein
VGLALVSLVGRLSSFSSTQRQGKIIAVKIDLNSLVNYTLLLTHLGDSRLQTMWHNQMALAEDG